MQKDSTKQLSRTLRGDSTPAERILWSALRNNQIQQYKFRRQHPIGPFVADFYCHEKKLIVEVDGDIHAMPDQIQHDRQRSQYLEEQGYRIIRFTNQDVQRNIQGVVERLLDVLGR